MSKILMVCALHDIDHVSPTGQRRAYHYGVTILVMVERERQFRIGPLNFVG